MAAVQTVSLSNRKTPERKLQFARGGLQAEACTPDRFREFIPGRCPCPHVDQGYYSDRINLTDPHPNPPPEYQGREPESSLPRVLTGEGSRLSDRLRLEGGGECQMITVDALPYNSHLQRPPP